MQPKTLLGQCASGPLLVLSVTEACVSWVCVEKPVRLNVLNVPGGGGVGGYALALNVYKKM